MTYRVPVACCVLATCLAGCASQCHVTNRVHRPLQAGGSLGRVVVYSVVSAETERDYHAKEARRVRESLKSSLEEISGTKVVRSESLPSQYYGQGVPNLQANFLEDAFARARSAGADTVCLVHLKEPGGFLSLGLPQLASVGGKCDYDVRLMDVASGEERFACSGSWSDRVEMPKARVRPDTTQLGKAIAESLRPIPVGHAGELTHTANLLSKRESVMDRGSLQ